MPLDLDDISPDAELVANGVWVPYGEPEEKARLKIGYARGSAFQRKVAKLQDIALQQTKGRKLQPDVIRNINRRAMVGTLLLDWESITVDGGQELPRGDQMDASLLRLLSNELLYDFVQEQASDFGNFKQEQKAADKADAKSSPVVES